jgi:hypothetical protein
VCSSPDIVKMNKSRRVRWEDHVARMGEKRNAYSVLVRKLERKRPLERTKRRSENNIKINLREIERGMDRINLAHDGYQRCAVKNTAVNLRMP